MKELEDYSGDYIPDLKLSDFSPQTLDKIVTLQGKVYLALDGFWYLAVKELFGNEKAFVCDMWAWEKVCKHEMELITTQLNIRGNSVIDLMKALQITSWMQTMKYSIEVSNPDRAILTINYCPILEGLEREGEGREEQICNVAGHRIFKYYASYFNHDIQVKGLRIAARTIKDDIYCQWEFSLD